MLFLFQQQYFPHVTASTHAQTRINDVFLRCEMMHFISLFFFTSYLVDCESSSLGLLVVQAASSGGGEVRGDGCQRTTAVAGLTILRFPPSRCCQAKEEQSGAVSQGFVAQGHRWRPRVVCRGRIPSTKQAARSRCKQNKVF